MIDIIFKQEMRLRMGDGFKSNFALSKLDELNFITLSCRCLTVLS